MGSKKGSKEYIVESKKKKKKESDNEMPIKIVEPKTHAIFYLSHICTPNKCEATNPTQFYTAYFV